jgi:2-keto-4-pentenoate hydratase/2-oxohepta-3-ene-1,7-dioic acid hydratase in catechol pathway
VRYCRFLQDQLSCYGAIEDRAGEPWIESLVAAPEEDLVFRLEHGGVAFSAPGFAPMPLRAANLLAAVTPSKIVCIGRNYRDHVKELNHELPTEPLFFLKPPSSLLEPSGVVRMPGFSARVDYEGELALVIGRRTRNLKEEDWRSALRGYTLANDVTARDLQNKDGQWTRAKSFDTFCRLA